MSQYLVGIGFISKYRIMFDWITRVKKVKWYDEIWSKISCTSVAERMTMEPQH